MRFLTSSLFHESLFSGPQTTLLAPFRLLSKICEDIRNSRFTHCCKWHPRGCKNLECAEIRTQCVLGHSPSWNKLRKKITSHQNLWKAQENFVKISNWCVLHFNVQYTDLRFLLWFSVDRINCFYLIMYDLFLQSLTPTGSTYTGMRHSPFSSWKSWKSWYAGYASPWPPPPPPHRNNKWREIWIPFVPLL